MSERKDEPDSDRQEEPEEELVDDESSDEGIGALVEDEIDDLIDDGEDLRGVEEALSPKDQNAKSLAIRRAIEQRMEDRKLDTDADYLDLDD